MINREECVLIGKITKKQGFTGQVVILGDTTLLNAKALPESVFIDIDGRLIPFFISSAEQQSRKSILISFMDITDILLDRILQKDVYVLKSYLEGAPEAAAAVEINGYEVYDEKHGFIGIADQLLNREIQPLLVLLRNDTEIMIPWTSAIIIRTDHQGRKILTKIPDGLLDIYLNG